MKPQRVLTLVHKGLEPPDEAPDQATASTASWRMEYDVVRTLKVLGHEVEKADIRMPQGPLKLVGDAQVQIALHSDVLVNITVSVLGEQ